MVGLDDDDDEIGDEEIFLDLFWSWSLLNPPLINDEVNGDFFVLAIIPGEMLDGDDLMLMSGEELGMLILILAFPG